MQITVTVCTCYYYKHKQKNLEIFGKYSSIDYMNRQQALCEKMICITYVQGRPRKEADIIQNVN